MTALPFDALRARHPRFVYERFAWKRSADDLELTCAFRLEPGIEFEPRTVIRGADWNRIDAVGTGIVDRFAFHLGLIETLSYWKAACSPELTISAGHLDPEQGAWFDDLLVHGMGEFFYVNQIDFRRPDLVAVRSEGAVIGAPLPTAATPSGHPLLLLSGGKDSAVSIEVLRRRQRPFSCLLLNPTKAATDLARLAGGARSIVVERHIDPRLLELNRAGYLNGHTPFSAYLAMLGAACAAWFGHDAVIASNERSSDEASGVFLDASINHQYSKSSRFEARFRDYLHRYLAPGIDYFSLLRPLFELQISKLFSRHRRYFEVFRSCNRGQATNSWCGRCPKCLFLFIALFPFLDRRDLASIFQRDLYAEIDLAPLLRDMVGLSEHRPFECVGTVDETIAALLLGLERVRAAGGSPPALLRYAAEEILPLRRDAGQLVEKVLKAWGDDHHVPAPEAAILREALAS